MTAAAARSDAATLEGRLNELEANGFVVIPSALTPEETERCRVALNAARANGWEEGLNSVGNMWFDHLLEQNPEVFRPLIAHPSVRPYLEMLYGPQCQLRRLAGAHQPGAIPAGVAHGFLWLLASATSASVRRARHRHQHHLLFSG